MMNQRNTLISLSCLMWIMVYCVKETTSFPTANTTSDNTHSTPGESMTTLTPPKYIAQKANLKAYDTNFSRCGDFNDFHQSSTSNICYYYAETGNMNLAAVKALCEEKDAHLASPSTIEKLEDLIMFMTTRNLALFDKKIWLGLYYPDERGVPTSTEPQNKLNWLWVDGSVYNPDESQWSRGEPGIGERWVRMQKGKWFATPDASDAEFFICEKELIQAPQTSISTNPTFDEIYTTVRTTTTNSPSVTLSVMIASTTRLSTQSTMRPQTVKFKRNADVLALIAIVIPVALIIIMIVVLIKKRTAPQNKTGVQKESEPYENYYEIDLLEIQGQYETLYHTLIWSEEYGRLCQTGIPGKNSGNTTIPSSQFLSLYPEIVRLDSQGQSCLDLEFQMINDSLSKHKRHEPNLAEGEYSNSSIVVKLVFNLDWKLTFITTKTPERDSITKDFWQAVQGFKCPIIINLCAPQQMRGKSYYPEVQGDVHFIDPFEVTCNSVEENALISQSTLTLSLHESEKQQISQLNVRFDLKEKSSREMQEIFLTMYKEIQRQKWEWNSVPPILIHCLDGATWTGLFGAYCFVLDQIQTQNQIDIFQVVSRVRFCCDQFIATKNQYALLYDLIFNFMKTSDAFFNYL